MSGTGEPVVLRVPADASFVSTVRIFAGAVGRHTDLAEERVDDLKLALSEVAAGMIGAGDHGVAVPLLVEITTDGGGLHVRCQGPAPGTGETDDLAADHRRRLLEAIVPDASWTRRDGEGVVTFSLPR
ncbi:MAG: ATP-binding protein [Actinomycetota bacterium]